MSQRIREDDLGRIAFERVRTTEKPVVVLEELTVLATDLSAEHGMEKIFNTLFFMYLAAFEWGREGVFRNKVTKLPIRIELTREYGVLCIRNQIALGSVISDQLRTKA